jgi:phosphoribosylformylglycinamidine (FGAM) synthase-like enzyme
MGFTHGFPRRRSRWAGRYRLLVGQGTGQVGLGGNTGGEMDKTKWEDEIKVYFEELIQDDPAARELIFRAIKSVLDHNRALKEGHAVISPNRLGRGPYRGKE